MGSDTARAVLYRFALPVTLLAACIVRYNGLSVIYLICLLVIPLLPSPSRRAACAVKLQQAILGLSAIAIAAHISFQISLIAEKSFASQIENCSFAEQISRQFGFNKFQRGDTVNVIRLLAPDVLVFIVSLVCVIGSRKVRAHAGSHSRMHRDSDATAVEDVLPVFVALMLLLGGIVQPNVISSVYFLVFLFLGTFWACHRSIRFKKNKGFFCLKMLLTVYSAIHVVLLYLYQIEFFQSLLASSSLYARLLGLPAIVESQCGYGNDLNINRRLNWPVYVYPVVIFLVYWILATEVRYKCSKKYEQSRTARQPFLWWNPLTWKDNPNESEHLLSEGDRRYSYRTFRGSPRVQPELPALQTEQPVEPISVQGTFSSIVMFLMRQNYIAALIVMMAWSITYHSWLTFVLLLWACLTWITPFARWFCMVSSPYLVIYAECLLIIQYIYGMNLNDEELPVKQGKLDYSELGLKKFDYPCLHLGAQTLFTWIFWITLRQHVRERKLRRRQVGETGELMLTTLARPIVQAFKKRSSGHPAERRFRGPESDIDDIDAGPPSDDAKEFMQWIRSTLAKYWILVCCAAFLLVALQKDVSLYQIFYMVTFLFGFIVYQFSVKVWKIVLRPLWWFMVIYSILILLIVYTYQFKNMHRYWKEGAGIKEDMLHDLGLRQHDKASLLVELLIPTLFSIALVIQLHFFHKPLTMKINHLIIHRKQSKQRETLSAALQSNPEESETETTHAKKSPPEIIAPESAPKSDSEPDTEAEGELTTLHKFLLFYKHSSRVLWRVAEIHMLKVISFVVMLVVVQQVSAFNAVLLLVLSVSMPSQRLQRMMNYFFVVWASIVVFGLMFYQLRFVNEDVLKYNCTAQGIVKPIPVMVGHFSSNARWMGLHKSSKVSVEVRGYLFIVLAIVFAKVVKHHQELYKFKKGIKMQPGVLFEGVTRSMADESIKNCIKYMCNNFFNCFGFEMNLMIMVICIAARCDAFAVLESLWIATFLFIRRKSSERLWPFYIGYLSIFLPLQYLLILGWPPGLCLNYPWTGHLSSNLVRWLYLTDVSKPQNQFVLLADFFQLLFACCQENCFANERRQRMESARSSLSTGTHLRPKSIKAAHSSHASTRSDHYIPADFMVNKTWLDFLKIVVLEQLYWLTLSIVYITAQTAASIFNAGFLLACFFFLWHGQSLYLRPKHTLRRWWKIFIGYNFLVIILKVWLQVASCVYIDKIKRRQKTGCVLIQLLNLYCLRQKEYAPPIYRTDDPNCLSEANTGLAVDAVCFIFAIIQYRIFKSIYFKYVIREHKKQSDMATRGAQLVEQRLNARLQESNEKDRKKMEEIKASVAKLKQKQEDLNPTQEEPLSHYEAIYSGDYYWYESDDEEVDKSKVVSKTSLPVITTVPPSVSSEEATPSPRSTEVTSPELPSRPSTSSSVEVEASSSSRSTNIESPSRSTNIESPSSSIRHRKKQKSPTDMSLTSSVSLIDLDVEYEETQETTNVTSEKTEEKQRTCMDSVREFGATCKKYFEDIANSMIDYFNEISADYRAIAEQLEREWTVKFKEHIKIVQQRRASREPQEGTSSDVERITSADKSNSGGSSSGNQEDDSDTWSFITVDEDQTDGWQKQDSVGVRFSVAFYYALLANTDLLCYALMIVNHMYYASMLSIPLPFFVVLWGMLSIPRPTKRFWIAIITYVELVIVVKYVFQFQFIMYNDCSYYENEKNNPLCPPRIIGIERGANSTVCDLLLLLGLFFHRFALKVHGLWREKAWQEEEDGSQHQRSPTFDETQTLEPVPVLDYNASSERSAAGKPQDTTLTPSSESTRSSERERRSVLSNIKRFIERMLDPGVGTGAVDVYAWMFGCQFIVFLIIIFNWSAFSSPESSKRNFAQIIEENVVPRTFLYMLLTQFILIMIDRYLYLRKLVFVKLLYMALLVFSFHIFMFLAVPLITTKKFIDNIPAIFMYVFQCMYFGLSAYQVRCGYPIRILGNFLTKSYTLTSGMLFQGIQSIPFLLELRSVLDWVCTDTTLSLSHWLKMEDIYANIYILKCWRDSEKTWPHPRGMKYWASSKILLGGLLIFLLIVVIWFPLLFMSFINSAFISNIPVDVTFTLSVGGYQPLFKMSAQQQFLHRLENWEIDQMSSSKGLAKTKGWDEMKAKAFFDDYKKKGNIVRIKVLSNSSAVWAISPPSRQFLIKELQSNASISIRFKYEFSREPNTSQAALVQETVSGAHVIPLKPYGKIRRDLRRILQSDKDGGEMVIKNLFPTFIQVPASGPAKAVQQLGEGRYVKCILKLRKGQVPQLNASQVEWWEIIQDTKQVFPMKDSLEIITFNDLVPPLHLSFFASKGIIGLYVGFVWLIGKFVRLFFSSISYRIMFDEMPNVNKVLKLCLGIYMVRESKEFKLEEDLFAKLLFLYRSPMTLIKWTKYKRM